MNKQLHTFTGMSEVKTKYAASGMTDTQFAEQISTVTGQQYSCAQVRAWRQALGIPNNRTMDERDHKIVALQNALNTVWAHFTEEHVSIQNLRKHRPEIVAVYEEAMK